MPNLSLHNRIVSTVSLAAACTFFAVALPAAPMVVGNYSAPRFSAGYTPCPAPYTGSSQPSSVDCMVEGGANSLLPNENLYAIVEARAGNRALNGDYELSIQNNSGSTSASGFQGQNAWANGQVYNFIVAFNPATQLLELNFNDGAITITRTFTYDPPRRVTDVFLRTTAATLGGAMAVNVNSITQNGVTTSFSGAQSAAAHTGLSEVEYLWITGLNPNQAWSLSGNMRMSWVTAVNSSSVAFQLKIGEANVPEPSTFAMLLGAFGLISVGALRRRMAAGSLGR